MSTAAKNTLRLVLDTNIYISAFSHQRGVPFHLWQHAAARSFVVLISPPIMQEVARVLRNKMHIDEPGIVARLKLIATVAQIVSPSIRLKVFAGTMEADNRVLECALQGKADLIVSGDNDLQRLKIFEKIPIIRPVDALRIFSPL